MSHKRSNVSAWSAAGGQVVPDDNGDLTLVNGTTYYAEIGFDEYSKHSVMWSWDATIVITSIEYERTNFPEASVFAAAGKIWEPTGITAITVAGGSAACAVSDFADDQMMRMRAKIVVGATGGKLRGRAHAKVR